MEIEKANVVIFIDFWRVSGASPLFQIFVYNGYHGSVAGPTATAADALSSVVKNNYTFTKLSYWALQFSNLHALKV